MERFPTWHIWRLLHTYPDKDKYEMLAQSLHLKPQLKRLLWIHNLWFWTILSYILGIAIFDIGYYIGIDGIGSVLLTLVGSILPLVIAIIALSFAWQVINAIIRHRDAAQGELINLLPVGEVLSMIDIARAYRFPFDGHLRGVRSALLLVGILVVVIFACVFLAPSINIYAIGANLFSGIFSFIGYTQMIVMTTLIAFLVSQHLRRSTALAILIVTYILVYITFNQINAFAYSFVNAWIMSPDNPAPDLNTRLLPFFWWGLFGSALISIVAHELVNFILWRAVKRRLED